MFTTFIVIIIGLQAKSRVLEMICTNIRERYNTLNLPAQINCPEPEVPDAVEGMMHPDQRAIVAAGRKVNAMFETISQVNKNVLQVNLFLFLITREWPVCSDTGC